MRLDRTTGLPILTLEEFIDQFCTEEEVLRAFEHFEGAASWSEPLRLEDEVLLPAFPLDCLPEWLGKYARQVAKFIQIDQSVAGIVALGALSTAAQRRHLVEPREGWTEKALVWTFVELESGERKTPLLNRFRRPFKEWERCKANELGPKIAADELELEMLKARQDQFKKLAAKAVDDSEKEEHVQQMREAAEAAASFEVETTPVVITTDATPEAFVRMCAENHGAMAAWNDEGTMLRILDGRYTGGVPAVEFLNASYSEGGDYRYSRASKESLHVPEPRTTLVQLVQPDVLRNLQNADLLTGLGFLARPLYCLPRSMAGYRKQAVENVEISVENAYDADVTRMLDLPMPTDDFGDLRLEKIRFSEEARRLLEKFEEWTEVQLRPGQLLSDFKEWGSKFVGQVVRIAGLLHLATEIPNTLEPEKKLVSKEILIAAIEIGCVLMAHSRVALLGIGADRATTAAKQLLTHIRDRNIRQVMARDLQQQVRGKKLLRHAEDFDRAAEVLEGWGYLKKVVHRTSAKGGRPSKGMLVFNPKAYSQNSHNPSKPPLDALGESPSALFWRWLGEDPEGPDSGGEGSQPRPRHPRDHRVPGGEGYGGGTVIDFPTGSAAARAEHEEVVELPAEVGDDSGPVKNPVGAPEGPGRTVEVIARPEALERLIAGVAEAEEVALDVETYPQDETNAALDPRRGRVRLVSVVAEGVSGVVDATKVDPTPLFEAVREKTLVAHNAGFDLAFLRRGFGYEHGGQVFDTQVTDAMIHYAAGPRVEKVGWRGFPQGKLYRRRLSEVAEDYLGVGLDKNEQTSDFGGEDLSAEQLDYALKDAEVLLPLKAALMERIEELGLERVAELESRVTPAVAYCEDNGFALDVEGWRRQAYEAAAEAAKLEEECSALAPPVPKWEGREDWNWGSTKQLGQALELLGTELPRHPTGNYKTNDETLKGINSPEPAVRLARAVLRRREAVKRSTTWGLGWLESPKKKPRGKKFAKSRQMIVDGRVYSSFQQVVKTGRMSSAAPNLQNIPPGLRRYFVAPQGRKLLIADYKQIELVTAAVVSGEEKLLEAFRRGDNVHALTARGILEADSSRESRPVAEDEVTAFRSRAKMVSFGIL